MKGSHTISCGFDNGDGFGTKDDSHNNHEKKEE